MSGENNIHESGAPAAASRPGLVALYRHFRGGGIYARLPRSRSNALYMAWKYWRKGTAWHVG